MLEKSIVEFVRFASVHVFVNTVNRFIFVGRNMLRFTRVADGNIITSSYYIIKYAVSGSP